MEEYHNPIYEILQKTLYPKFCIDIGANYGYTGLLMAQRFPQANLTLVEPVPWLEPYIRHNFTTNAARYDDLYSAICSVGSLGDRSSFGVRDRGTQDSRVIAQPGMTVVETAVVTLDQICEKIGPDDGAYIKIDTQGWEERVFRGGEGFMSNHGRWFAKTEFAPQWLESQGTDPVALLGWLLARYAVHESLGRVRYGCQSLDDAIGPAIGRGDEERFVNYVRNLALNDKGWIDLYILPLPEKRRFRVGLRGNATSALDLL